MGTNAQIASARQQAQAARGEAAQARRELEVANDYLHHAHERIDNLEAQIAAMRPVVEAVAGGVSYHATIMDVWVLLLSNPTLSYVQEIRSQARAFVAKYPAPAESEADA